MPLVTSFRLQAAGVIALFLISLAALFVNVFEAVVPQQRELDVRQQLVQVSRQLVTRVFDLAQDLNSDGERLPRAVNREWGAITSEILGNYPGVEGGFYVGGELEDFLGYAFPTGEKSKHRGPSKRTDPPPKETPYIRLQARESLSVMNSDVLVSTRDVGLSRVVVATAAIGSARPARCATWVMYRLSGPEQLESQVRRYQLSTGLAIGGLAGAILLTANLGRTSKRERREQDRLREELRRAEHLASLGKLLAEVAHEVRNPLAGIRSTVQLWQRLPLDSQTPESLQAVVGAVDRLDALLRQLLYFSRAENIDQQSVDLNSVVRESLELLRAQAAQQNVHVDLDLDSRLPEIRGSVTSLRQLVLNLTTNALQAMPHSGRFCCRTRWHDSDHTVEMEISDTGPGIDPAVRARLFEPFFTTRPEGTGLGLALCREIVLRHNGNIELESGKPLGTVCRVVLPAGSPPGREM